MNNNFDGINKEKLINSVIANSGGKIDKSSISAAQNGDFSGILSALSESDRSKLESALKGDNLKKMLSSEDAKAIINKMLGGGN